SSLSGLGNIETEIRNYATRRSRTRVRTAGRSIDQRDETQNKFASALAAPIRVRVRYVSAHPAIDGNFNWDTDKAMPRTKHLDLTHEFPPDEFSEFTQLAGR
ncbi:MAG: hypothetical protein ABR956_19150, partial [Terracidiphilus sp.]